MRSVNSNKYDNNIRLDILEILRGSALFKQTNGICDLLPTCVLQVSSSPGDRTAGEQEEVRSKHIGMEQIQQ